MNRSYEDRFDGLALLTDLYQLTMAFGYWKKGKSEQNSVFHLFFRKHPFAGGYVVAAGLGPALSYLERFRFSESDLEYLAMLRGNDGEALFDEAFLRYLEGLRLSVDVDAMREGSLAFAHEPLLRIRGPILQCQLVETALLNIINFQSLIATKASRMAIAAAGDPILEFGLRRAQGIDGALSASRAAYIGGCEATSNVLAGKLMGIPVRGTHAHSWVMSFDTEAEAFEAYMEAMPNNCVFLVDTYDTIEGIRHAVQAGLKLKAQGKKMIGIRLDSGDLTHLSIQARKMLDEAGLTDAVIVASNDLDERLIESMKHQGAKIGVWGVGTKLVTAYDQPALGGVYKLGAIENSEGEWVPKMKLSEQIAKASTPGVLQVRRFFEEGKAVGDMILNELSLREGVEPRTMIDPIEPFGREIGMPSHFEDLVVPCMRRGVRTEATESLQAIRERSTSERMKFHGRLFRFDNPHLYPVGLESSLYVLKRSLSEEAFSNKDARGGTT